MRPKDVKETLGSAYRLRQPVFVWGPPGVGKSETVAQVAEELGIALIDMRLSLLSEVDLRGIPSVRDNLTTWNPPDFLPRDGKGILFIDEMNLGRPAVLSASYQLILDRKLGDYELPAGWTCVAAGNRQEDRSNVTRMPTALASRFLHVDYEVHVEDWIDWALAHDVSAETIAFIRFRPELLHSFDPRRNERVHPNPRAHVRLDLLLQQGGLPAHLEHGIAAGLLGEAAAAERMAFRKLFLTIPDPHQCLIDPQGSPMPEDPATKYAICGALARIAGDTNFGRLCEYIGRMEPEYQVLAVRDAARLHPEVCKTRAFQEWAARNSEVLM